MSNEDTPLQIERNPTPKGEAADFENPDEKRLARKNKHELDLLDKQLGKIGCWVGSIDPSLNIAFVLLGVIAFLLLLSGIGINFKVEFQSITDKLITALLTVAGYVFGRKTSSEK